MCMQSKSEQATITVQQPIHNMIQDMTNTPVSYAILGINFIIPCSWKYWQELNLVVEPKIPIAKILADLKLTVQ